MGNTCKSTKAQSTIETTAELPISRSSQNGSEEIPTERKASSNEALTMPKSSSEEHSAPPIAAVTNDGLEQSDKGSADAGLEQADKGSAADEQEENKEVWNSFAN